MNTYEYQRSRSLFDFFQKSLRVILSAGQIKVKFQDSRHAHIWKYSYKNQIAEMVVLASVLFLFAERSNLLEGKKLLKLDQLMLRSQVSVT